MKAAQKTVEDIKRVLIAGKVPINVDGPLLAQQYTARCKEANDRLRLCRQYITNGMPSEAMHVAEARPILLDLCAVLDFLGADDWATLCGRSGWPAAEKIDSAAIEVLNDSYSSAMSLEPTIQRYRRAVRDKDIRGCILLLRQIIALDPGNKNWEEDIKGFELKRMEELRQASAKSDVTTHVSRLEELLAELDGEWSIPKDASLRREIAAALQNSRERGASDDCRKIMESLSSAYSALDYGAVERLVTQYNELMSTGYFKPDEVTQSQFDDANAWFIRERESREKESAFQATLANLQAELSREKPTSQVERLWSALGLFGMQVPPDVEQRAHNAIHLYRILESRHRRYLVALGVSAALAMACVIVGTVWTVQYRRARVFWAAEIKKAYESNNLTEFRNVKAEIKAYHPLLFGRFLVGSTQIQDWFQKEPQLEKAYNKKRVAFQEKCDQLAVLGKQGFPCPPEKIVKLLQEAGALAVDPDQKTVVEELQNEWKDHCNNSIENTIKFLSISMPTASAFSTNSFEVVNDRLNYLRGMVTTGLYTKGAAPAYREELEPYISEIAALDAEVAMRQKAYSQIESAEDLRAYLQALDSYASMFPDDYLSQQARDVSKRREQYEFAWNAIVEFNKYFLDRKASFAKSWPDIQTAIRGLSEDPTLASLRTYIFLDDMFTTGRKPERLGFVEDSFKEPKGRLTYGRAYVPTYGDTQPSFIRRGVYSDTMKTIQDMAHCAYVTTLVQKAGETTSDSALEFLFTQIALLSNTDVSLDAKKPEKDKLLSAFLKLKLIKFLGKQATSLAGAGSFPPFEVALQEVAQCDNEKLSWLCILNKDVETKSKEAAAVLEKHFKNPECITMVRFGQMVAEKMAGMDISWVGFAGCRGANDIHLLKNTGPRELWVVRRKSDIVVVAERGASGTYAFIETLEPYEPVFAPSGTGGSTRDVVKDIAEVLGIKDLPSDKDSWPPCWPMNRRTLTSGKSLGK